MTSQGERGQAKAGGRGKQPGKEQLSAANDERQADDQSEDTKQRFHGQAKLCRVPNHHRRYIPGCNLSECADDVLRRFATISVSAAVFIGPAVSVANPAATASGRLAGKTQISFGCPGPTTEPPSCNPWRLFVHARFSLAQRASGGDPISGTRRVVTSDARGRFALRLSAGSYLITPLPERHTHGGTRVVVHVRTGETTTTLVRFDGFPQME
jgi:hypothetical protein